MLDWEQYQHIASFYRFRVPPADSQEVVDTIILEMADAALRRDGQGTPKAYLEAIARHVVADYWRERRKRHLSLNRPTRDTGGLELHETLPGDSGDHDARLDAKLGLKACRPRVQRIARKLERGDPLTPGESAYLRRFRQDGNGTPNQRKSAKRYSQRRALGLCVRCGGPTEGGFARCPRCREIYRRYQALYKRRKGRRWYARLRGHWRNEGRCPRCGRPPEPGRKKCPQCLAKDREYLRAWRQRHSDSWQTWYAQHGEEYNARRRQKRRRQPPGNSVTAVDRGFVQ